MPPRRTVTPVSRPLDAVVRLPGSKSITNRALLVAALADGTSRLTGVLDADDTAAMAACLAASGVRIERDGDVAVVHGCAGRWPASEAHLDARQSGTTARFLLPALATARGRYHLDGAAQLRRRPFADQLDALAALGARIESIERSGALPVVVEASGLAGGTIELRADVSSQFASGLLMAAPLMRDGLVVRLVTEVVSRPYLDMTLSVMEVFGADVRRVDDATVAVAPGGYRSADLAVEPDASAASYFLAAAAVCGGTVTVEGLGSGSVQGDARFAAVLEDMGATVTTTADRTTVTVDGPLRGVEVDMAAMSDTAQTLAVVAPFATSPTRVTGIGFVRAKETDRIGATVTELRRCGVDAEEEDDGFVVRPGRPHGALVRTYDDHRMAMSFALLGLAVPGIEIADPGCVAKTFPGYWDALAGAVAGAR
jgi:3-phosphoshikimate 1-carboxyvinyltransferase